MKKSQKTQDKILQMAIKTFCEKGYNGTSTKEISEDSGVSEATLFKYFKSKENLFHIIMNDLVDYYKDKSRQEVERIISQADQDTYNTLKSIADNRIRFLEKHDMAIKVLHQEAMINPKLKKMLTDEVWPTISGTISKIFEKGIDNGEIRDDIPVPFLTTQYITSMATPVLASYLATDYDKKKRSDLIRSQFEYFYLTIKRSD